jgi:hypothetical protein
MVYVHGVVMEAMPRCLYQSHGLTKKMDGVRDEHEEQTRTRLTHTQIYNPVWSQRTEIPFRKNPERERDMVEFPRKRLVRNRWNHSCKRLK